MTSHDKQKGIVRSVLICLIGILRITYTVSQRGYYAFGSDQCVVGTPATDHRFTGQKVD